MIFEWFIFPKSLMEVVECKMGKEGENLPEIKYKPGHEISNNVAF